jgi:peptide/nickel transport system permease protein
VLALLCAPALLPGSFPGPSARSASVPSDFRVRLANADLGGPGPIGWPTFHGSENRTGYSAVDGPTTSDLLWVACVSSLPIRVSPVWDGRNLYVADNLGTVYALDPDRLGSVLWSRALGTTPTTADVAAGRLVIGGSSGSVSALSTADGSVLWQRSVGGAPEQAVSVENGTVAVGTSAGTVTALNLTSGALLWQTSVGAPVGGALAWDGRAFYAVTTSGELVAVSAAGTVLWRTAVGAASDTAPAVFAGTVYVADRSANVTAVSAATGAVQWRFSGSRAHPGDAIEDTPAVTESRLYVQTDQGFLYALSRATGSPAWIASVPPTGYAVPSSPVATPAGVYFVDATENVDDVDPGSGQLLWQGSFSGAVSYSSPAIENGTLAVGTDTGCVYDFGRVGGPTLWPVTGIVTTRTGAPIAGAYVTAGTGPVTTDSLGRFRLALANGSYDVSAYAGGYAPATIPLTVRGPVSNVRFALAPLTLYPVAGEIVDSRSGRGIAGVSVALTALYGFSARAVTDRSGAFRVLAPNGTDFFSVGAPPGYLGFSATVVVSGAAIVAIRIALVPVAYASSGTDPLEEAGIALPLVAIGLAAAFLRGRELLRRRVAAGLPARLFSPFARFVAMRALLLPAQIVAVLTVLFVFGTFLPAAALHQDPCVLAAGACTGCSWSNVGCVLLAFFRGYGLFVTNLFTGQWGTATYGHLREPAVLFLQWWLPDSLELAVIALALSALIAYPVGLRAGWRPSGPFDTATRLSSLTGLLVPSFLVILALLLALYGPFSVALGDTPYGTLPSLLWFDAHGGVPGWIGIADNTGPTGFPLVDGALHGDAAFELVVLAKTLLQALAIALVYVAIFLRYVRTAVADSARAPFVSAARARGVSEQRLLWGHVGRRVLPLYALVFGLTLPIYLGTQALAEALFNDIGVGTLLLGEMTGVASARFGFGTSAGVAAGNFYQVTIFLLLIAVLVGSLAADVFARYLDPRLRERAP